MNREEIEIKLIEYNEHYFKKPSSSNICKDTIFRRLNEDGIRNKTRDRILEYKECNDQQVYNFLSLLQKQ